jgi:Putative beta-barrel porin-2, OmpL-like. bbp2
VHVPGRGPLALALAFALASTAARAQSSDSIPNSIFVRLWQSFGNDWHTPAYTPPDSAAPPGRRGLPTPFDSPPFPTGDWQVGGTPIIGDPNTLPAYPLMEALTAGNHGSWLKKSRINIYGWIDVAANFSTSKTTNAPAAYDIRPDHLELDQFLLYIERTPDEDQTDHVDWGFRISQLYGLDYRFTTMKGILSQQLLQRNNIYGYDPVMVYADVYVPRVFQGLNIRVGRYISLPDIEAQLAPNNLTLFHSLLYTYDPYTQIGIVGSFKLTKNWLVQLGVNGGNDVALGTTDAQPTLLACVQWVSSSNTDSFYPCINSLNNGKYSYNNLQDFVATYSHKFNEKWWTTTESWYMYERDVPNIAGNVANPITPETGANGAFCSPGHLTCTAPEWSILNYTLYRMTGNSFLTIRNEFFDDIKGQRTGFKTKYTENGVGITFWPNRITTVRPELRYEHSYDLFAYDGGSKPNQFIAAVDVIFHY